MLLSMLPAGQLLIPLFAIIFAFAVPIIAIYLYYRHKTRIMDERKLMIERGMTPPDLADQMADSKKKDPLSKGIDMLAVAVGIVLGYFASTYLGVRSGLSIICGILFFLGIANIIKSFLLKNEFDSYE